MMTEEERKERKRAYYLAHREEERKVYSSDKLNRSLADGNKRNDLRLLCRSCHHKIHNNLRSNI